MLYLIFVLSGAAGLIYETIWSRYLGLFVGHSAYAQVIVLVIYLGGMSLGALAAGARSERLRFPLLWYAGVELAVGILGFLFHPVFVGATAFAYDTLFPALGALAAVTVARWTLAALLILPQSVLLGATFPLIAAGALRRTADRPGHVLALLYFANSIGGAAGVLVAGFALIAAVGLPGTLATAAALDVVVALGAVAVARLTTGGERAARAALGWAATAHRHAPVGRAERRAPSAEHAAGRSAGSAVPLFRLLLAATFTTAVSSFFYEIAWIRMLSLVLGSATHSFELMLSAFILGIALGALWARSRADRWMDPLRALGIVQWIMGALAIATLPLYMASFGWTAWLIKALDYTPQGYDAFTVARYGLCILVMVPATFCAGITLPLITKTLLRAGVGERAVGAVYGWNTLGSILGVVVAALVLMPLIGLKALLVSGGVIDMGLGVVLLAARAEDEEAVRPLVTAGVVAAGALVALAALTTPFDRGVLTSGVYRYGRVSTSEDIAVPFYHDGRTATVSVRHGIESQLLTLATNGKPDASLGREWLRPPDPGAPRIPIREDQSTQVLLPVIALAYAPRAREAAVIGQGSGMTSELLLGSPALRRLTTVEIEPEMVRASRLFYPANHRDFDDPRSRIAIDDARSYFAARRRRWDIILSEPSNPWVSGVSGLFTTEFYRHVRRYLAPRGVFAQWLHLYEIDDDLVLSVIASIDRSFGAYDVYLVGSSDILIVATTADTLPAPDWSVVHAPGVAEDLRRVIPFAPDDFEAMRLADRATLHPLIARGVVANSDFHPILDLRAERTRYLRVSARGFEDLQRETFDPVRAMAGRALPLAARPVAPAPDIPALRARALGARLRAVLEEGRRDTLGFDDAFAAALFRDRLFESSLAGREPPLSWALWVGDALDVAHDLEGGSAGVADERFTAMVDAYLHAVRAPDGPRQAFAFSRAVARWDWPVAAALADSLSAAMQHDRPWLPPDLLRDGGVVAKLRTGDPDGAMRLEARLEPFTTHASTRLRSRLLEAWIAAARAEDGRAHAAR